jgi:hypothetical protein
VQRDGTGRGQQSGQTETGHGFAGTVQICECNRSGGGFSVQLRDCDLQRINAQTGLQCQAISDDIDG